MSQANCQAVEQYNQCKIFRVLCTVFSTFTFTFYSVNGMSEYE